MVDNSVSKQITTYLRGLGLTNEEASIYVALTEHGSSTPLRLSRFTGINRTKVYRTIESLAKRKLAAVEIDHHSTRVTPSDLTQLSNLVRHKQQRAAQIAHDFPEIEQQLASLGATQSADTKVRFYRGRHGIEQMVWNVLKAHSEIVGYTYRDLSDFVGETFMDEFVSEFVRRNLTMRDVYGDEYVKSEHTHYDWMGHVKSRFISDHILTIPHQMDIYDDVVTFYNWHEGEVFGVEIRNEKVSSHQRQLFELAWGKATPR